MNKKEPMIPAAPGWWALCEHKEGYCASPIAGWMDDFPVLPGDGCLSSIENYGDDLIDYEIVFLKKQ